MKTGVFHVLSTNRFSADGAATTTSGGAHENSPSDGPFAPQQPMRSAPELLRSPSLHGFPAPPVTGGSQHQSADGTSPGSGYSVPMHHGAYTDPTDQLPRSLAFSIANQGVLPVSCNTDPLPHRSPDAQTRMSSHGGSVGPAMLSAPPPQLPAALPPAPSSAASGAVAGGAPVGMESLQDRTAALHMRALMEAMHMMQTHGPDSVAAQHACMIAQATGRLGPQGMPNSAGMGMAGGGMVPGDMDLMRQLASQMHMPNSSAQVASGVHGGLPMGFNPQFQAAMQGMWPPPAAAAGVTPTTSTAVAPVASSPQAAGGAPASPLTASVGAAGGVAVASAFAASAGGPLSRCGAPSGGATVSGDVAVGGSSAGKQGAAADDVSASSAGGSPSGLAK